MSDDGGSTEHQEDIPGAIAPSFMPIMGMKYLFLIKYLVYEIACFCSLN